MPFQGDEKRGGILKPGALPAGYCFCTFGAARNKVTFFVHYRPVRFPKT